MRAPPFPGSIARRGFSVAVHSKVALSVGLYGKQVIMCPTAYPLLPYRTSVLLKKGHPFVRESGFFLTSVGGAPRKLPICPKRRYPTIDRPFNRSASRFVAVVVAVEREAAEKRKEAGRA